jgi:hypothetical protein
MTVPGQAAPRKQKTFSERVGPALGLIIVGVLLCGGPAFGVYKYIDKHFARDSGVAACKSFKNGDGMSKQYGIFSYSEQAYSSNREAFTKSKFADLRDAGPAFLDAFRQVTIDIAGTTDIDLESRYANFAIACANHGVPMPTISELISSS